MELERLLHILDVMKSEALTTDPYMRGWVEGRNTALDSVAKQARLEDALRISEVPAVELVANYGDDLITESEWRYLNGDR